MTDMTDEDRQAWRDMAGPQFQTWMQQEMGIAMARLNMRGFMETTKEELEKLKDGQIDQRTWLDVMDGLTKINKNTMEMLGEIRVAIQRLSEQIGGLSFNVRELGAPTTPTIEEAAQEPEKIQTPRLTPRQHKVLDYIAQHPKCNQSAMVFHLEISKTTLSEILSELFDLGTIERERIATSNGGHTYIYTSTYDVIPMLPPDAAPPPVQNKTTIGQIMDFLRDQPWSTAAQVHDGIHWLGPVPPVNTVAAALSNGVKDAKLQVLHNGPGERSRYAPFGLPLPADDQKDRAQATRELLVLNQTPVPPKLNLFEQVVVKTIKKFKEPLTPQDIADLARQHDMGDIQVNSVRSVCGRLVNRGILEARFAGDRSVVHYALKA